MSVLSIDSLPPLFVGATFTTMGLIKLYGLHRGIIGGRNVPLAQRLCGT